MSDGAWSPPLGANWRERLTHWTTDGPHIESDVACDIRTALAELDRMQAKLDQISRLHYLADDDPGEPPYCPECQAYDGTGSPCATRRILDEETR